MDVRTHECTSNVRARFEADLVADPVVPLLYTGTQEGQKVERNSRDA